MTTMRLFPFHGVIEVRASRNYWFFRFIAFCHEDTGSVMPCPIQPSVCKAPRSRHALVGRISAHSSYLVPSLIPRTAMGNLNRHEVTLSAASGIPSPAPAFRPVFRYLVPELCSELMGLRLTHGVASHSDARSVWRLNCSRRQLSKIPYLAPSQTAAQRAGLLGGTGPILRD